MKDKKKNNDIKLLGFILNNFGKMTIVLFLVLLFAAFQALVPYSLSFIIDNAIIGKNTGILIFIIIILGIGAIVVAVSQVVRDYLYLDFCSQILRSIREKTFKHLQNLSIDFYSSTQPGEVISRFSTDLAVVEQALIYAPNYFIAPLFNIIMNTVLLFVIDVRLALIAMLIFPACLIGPYFLTPRASRAGFLRKKTEATTISDVQTNISSQSVVKALNLQGLSTHYFDKDNKRFYKTMLNALFTSALVDRSGIAAVMILEVVVLAIGSFMAVYGTLEIGQLVAFQALFMGLSYSIITTSAFIPMIVQYGVGIGRVNQLLSEKPKLEDIPGAKELRPFCKEIKFENVTFGYTESMKNLDDLSITIPKNTSSAFVGPSGCGKSTILNLIMRFYDPREGKVTFDGRDIKMVSQASIRNQLGIVLQDNILFNISIMDNLLIAKLNATKEEVYEATKQAEIHDVILSLPEGYRTLAGERGSQLSGGQRQRLAIARALLRGANILILDEATSALDPVSEAAINETLHKIAKAGKTIISVTHRLASAVNMDSIFVMNNGKVVEKGSHNELLEMNGAYKQMWDKQS